MSHYHIECATEQNVQAKITGKQYGLGGEDLTGIYSEAFIIKIVNYFIIDRKTNPAIQVTT